MNILVSACLLGVNCRYKGDSQRLSEAVALMGKHHLIPVCPEVYGGLPTPRKPAEQKDGRVVTKDGRDVTGEFLRGAQETLKLARLYGCRCALLKERSPSCGYGEIYDGSFTGTRKPGNGIAAGLLAETGIRVFGETDIAGLLAYLEKEEEKMA